MSQLSKNLKNSADGRIVIFDDVISIVGRPKSNTTDVFRAPVHGNFMFSVIGSAAPKSDDNQLHLLLKKNGITVGYLFSDLNHDYYLKKPRSWLLP